MSEGFEEGARWLQSDSQILGRVTKEPHDEGILVTLEMPTGGGFQCVLAKLDAASATQFCEMARGEYHERKAKQASQASRKRFDERESGGVQEGTPGTQEAVAVDPLDIQSVKARYAVAEQELREVSRTKNKLIDEVILLRRILEVLGGEQSTDEKESPSVSGAKEEWGPGEGEDMDSTARPEANEFTGTETTGSAD